jgi:hypothetical protein
MDWPALRQHLLELARARSMVEAAELAAVGTMDRCGYFVLDGAASAKAWLTTHTKQAGPIAGSGVRLARRLRRMPRMEEALRSGTATLAHVRLLARCLTPRTVAAFARDEEMLVERATQFDADEFALIVDRWLAVNDPDGPEAASGPSRASASAHFGGRVKVDADLDAEDGAEFLAELESIYDELWHEDQRADDGDPNRTRSPSERNAAAMIEMARRSSTCGRLNHDDDDIDEEEADDDAPSPARPPRRPYLLAIVDIDPRRRDRHPRVGLDAAAGDAR